MEKRIFLIDICGTMFKSNTTFDFVRYFYGKEWRVRFMFSIPYRIYNHLMFRFFKYEPLRRNLIYRLKGKTKDELAAMADVFLNDYLKGLEQKPVIDVIESMRSKGLQLIALSATIDVIAQTVASHYHIPTYYSTSLEYDANGICKGKIKRDLLSRKLTILKEKGFSTQIGGIVTDNYSDKELIEISQVAYLVTDTSKKDKWHLYIRPEKLKQCKKIEVC